MKKNLTLFLFLFLLFSQLTTTAYGEIVSKIIDWSQKKTWSLTSAPRDFAVSFDKKKYSSWKMTTRSESTQTPITATGWA
ncbi:MAG: hypothetical protein D3922_12150 [Candidatus Electrothrix sp. AR1]|nr:hypothetical protein [Candidatus Electrothrix sp. AR1]